MFKALVDCAMKSSPIMANDELLEYSPIDDDWTFGLVDAIKKKLHEMVNRIRCVLRIIGEVIGEGELRNVFEDFKYNVTKLLRTDVQQCTKTKGLTAKVKYVE